MLKYRINTNNIESDNELIVVNKISFVNSNLYNLITKENTLKTVVCYSHDIKNLKVGTKLTTYNNILLTDIIDINDTTVVGYENNFKISTINLSNGSFSFTIPKFKYLSVSNVIDENGYRYIYFNDNHFFQRSDEGELNDLWVLNNGNFNSTKEFEIVSNNAIRYEITNDTSNLLDNVNFDEVNLYRENYLFTNIDNFEIYFSNPKCVIPIGLTNTNQINLLKEQGLIDYVNKTKEESINSIVDMEKDVYTPVVYGGMDKDKKPIFDNIIGIKFNLHFRERNLNDGKWLTETGSLWNGIEKGDKKFNKDYFSYNDKNKQSDLLSYLGFTDNDVRYQKSKLKKSFLRISFYDSMNMGDQNLLAYSTIYMNGGEYFSKYIRHINDEIYHKSGESQKQAYLKGIRVNREPYNINDNDLEEYRLSSQIKVFDKYNSNSSSEGFYLYLYKDLFIPTDGNQTLTLYAKVEFNHAGYGRTVPFMMPYWDKNKWNGEERNGVEYGVKTGIKSFDDIRKDWLSDHIIDKDKDNNIVKYYWQFVDKDENGEDKSEITDGQYGAKQYTKFSYIRFKITYDESQKRYIYYLDNETYGNINEKTNKSNIENNNILLLNLYEANMI